MGAVASRAYSNEPIDIGYDDREVVACRAAIMAGDTTSTRTALARLGEARDWAGRSFVVRAIVAPMQAVRPPVLDEWLRAEPGCAEAFLVSGAHGVVWAWHARGGGYISTVSDGAYATFRERLLVADTHLMKAAELAPTDPTPWTLALKAARGLELSDADVAARFRVAIDRDPQNLDAHLAQLQKVCAKWGGSHEAMFAFAASVSSAAPEGSLLHQLVPLAHMERLLALDDISPEEYFAMPRVVASIMAAAERCVLSSRLVVNRDTPEARHAFACAFHYMRRYDLSRVQLEAVTLAPREWPWMYYGRGRGREAIDKARAKASLPPIAW